MGRSRRALWLIICLFGCSMALARGGQAAGPSLVINEILVGNASTTMDPTYFNYSPWIELRNIGSRAVSLKNFTVRSLPEGAGTWQSYKIPTATKIPAGGYLLLWADEERKGVHLSYDLDMDGGQVALFAPDGTPVDSVLLSEQEPDVSFGRSPDGNSWAYFDRPTPSASNASTPFAAPDRAAMPQFSLPGGLHAGQQVISLSSADPGAIIRYTLDGARPTVASPIYNDPLIITTNTVIRARAWTADKMTSPTATETYLIDVPANLPIITIAADPAHLWDPIVGIYTKGTNGIKGCNVTANWNQAWERPAAIEFFEIDGVNRLNQEVGLEIFGNCTRNYRRKSLEIKARKVYGDSDMDYAFFAGSKPMTAYKRLILRNAGQDNSRALLRDALSNTLVAGRMDLDTQSYRPAVVYLNGQYWGLYDMREKMDEDYVENNYDLDEAEFDVIEQNGRLVSGSNGDWKDFINDLSRSNLSAPAVYANVRSRMDVGEFMNYLIVHMVAGVSDWPNRNTRLWDDHGGAYRWRWMMRDLDSGFESSGVGRDMFAWMKQQGGPTATISRRLLTNDAYRAEFGQRFAFHLNTTFDPPRVIAIIDTLQDAIRPEMPAHIARWGVPATVAKWESEVQVLRDFATQRPANVREHVRLMLGGPPDANLTVNIVGGGRVLISGGEITELYSGPHFQGIPIVLEALPAAGSRFVEWLETGETTPVITLPFDGDTTRTAVYETEPRPPILINELHYEPSPSLQGDDDTYEFLELYNGGDSPVALSGFTIDGVTFAFPANATIAAGEYLVVADTPSTYAGNGYQVFDFDGGLSSSGETITLRDAAGYEVDSVTYDDAAPWPAEPKGGGPSLSLLSPALDNSQAANWAAGGQTGGTPGAPNFP